MDNPKTKQSSWFYFSTSTINSHIIPTAAMRMGQGLETPLVTSTQNLYFVPSHNQICMAIQSIFLKAIYG